jgi:hypothetical protein
MRRWIALAAVVAGLQLGAGCSCHVMTGICDCCNHPDDRGIAEPVAPVPVSAPPVVGPVVPVAPPPVVKEAMGTNPDRIPLLKDGM